jgi:RHS repeat-associated protein
MTRKTSAEATSTGNRVGDSLNYNLEYKYYEGTHKAERIGNRYYSYDLNGNLIAEREGSHATTPEIYRPSHQDGNTYSVDYGFGLVRPEGNTNNNDGVYQRNYRWNERNLLSESSDLANTVHYRYGADGQRALKYVSNTTVSTVYFNKMWQTTNSTTEWLQSKHVYLGEDRVATKFNSEGNPNTLAEERRVYYYHTDHLGSAQTITNYRGDLHERLEYTPYGELWIDWQSNDAIDSTPFRFTGKERDPETSLYYFGARYLDPKTSRWLSTDPAMYQGDYIPSAPINKQARERNGNLPGMGGVFNYVNLHVYHYGGNNPIKYVDPNGEEIYVPNEGDRNTIEEMINNVSSDKYKFDKDGYLFKVGGIFSKNGFFGLGRSKEFSARLQEGINSGKTIRISISDDVVAKRSEGSDYDIGINIGAAERGGGGVTSRVGSLVFVAITGRDSPNEIKMTDGTSSTYSPTEILVHEMVGHAIPIINNQNGDAINNENKVRSQMGWKERLPDALPHSCFD